MASPAGSPPAATALLIFTVVVAGTIDSFDHAAYKTSLAAQLDGISPADITLEVSAASVRVEATISAPSAPVGTAALSTLTGLAATPSMLSAALGVAVEEVVYQPSMVSPSSGDTPRGSSGGGDDATGSAATGIVTGAAVGGTLLLLLVLVFAVRRGWVLRAAVKTTTAKAVTAQAVDPDDIDVETHSAPTSTSLSDGANAQARWLRQAETEASDASSESSRRAEARREREHRESAMMREWEWAASSIEWEEVLGSGSYGHVYRVKSQGLKLAAKRMDVKARADRTTVEKHLRTEFRALAPLQHPNIVRIIGVVLDNPEWVCMLMELANRGSLRQLLDETPEAVTAHPKVQLSITRDIVNGMAYLHAHQPKPILHHDIKSANVLLHQEGGDLVAKLADFGLAVGAGDSSFGSMSVNAGVQPRGLAGTYACKDPHENASLSLTPHTTPTHDHTAPHHRYAYMSPEQWTNEYRIKSEVYSFAIVLWEILTGERPWQHDTKGVAINHPGVIMALVKRGDRPPLADGVGLGALNAMAKKCWCEEEEERPTFERLRRTLELVRTSSFEACHEWRHASSERAARPATAAVSAAAPVTTHSAGVGVCETIWAALLGLLTRMAVHPFFYLALYGLLIAKVTDERSARRDLSPRLPACSCACSEGRRLDLSAPPPGGDCHRWRREQRPTTPLAQPRHRRADGAAPKWHTQWLPRAAHLRRQRLS
jgi:hypothetical protein